MEFYFENQGTNTYLVYKINPSDNLDSMSLGMITNNSIRGLATALFTQMNSTQYIKYDVSAKVSVSQMFMGPVNKKRLVGVFSGIVNALLSAEDYMIDANSIVLDLDYIFTDVSTCETVLICLPIVFSTNGSVNLRSFFKNLLFNIQPDQTENCDYVAKIINYLNGTPCFSLLEFKKVLDELNDTATKTVKSSKVVEQNNGIISNVNHERVRQTIPVSSQISTSPQQENSQSSYVQQVQVPPTNQVSHQSYAQQEIQSKNPGKSKKTSKQVVTYPEPPALAPGEKPISMLTLMMHYSKENAAKYKAQKAARKAQSGANRQSVDVQVQKQTQNHVQQSNSGFAIPGQQNQSFAIPGQGSGSSQTVTPPQNYSSVTTPVSQQPINQQVQPVSQGYNPNSSYSESPTDFGPTTVLGGNSDGATAVLSDIPAYGEEHVKQPVLIRVRNNERIPIDKPYFRIGKEKSYVDYFIGDNSYISRGHASIITRDGRYFIVDNNSRNHTYVNGQIITSSTEVELQSGYTIKLANEEFEFKLF